MPDCSYFLQGLCTNRNCPYRHVNVNPKASVCEGFLRGYCADGNECRKKHTYVCPTFQATGSCTQGSKCKLHHPQKQGKGKKRKRCVDQRNCKRRYFGSLWIDVSEPGTMVVAPRQGEQNKDGLEGELADYISLDVEDEDVAELPGRAREQSTLCDGEPGDIVLDDEDELIKPVLIMKKDIRAKTSPV
ncbi:zinc finger CCCH domain-containing protein 7-like [Neltuma alba]|nr:zinc finger CCCH domain-containing protein 7-like [Prosopis alba]